MKKLKSIRSGAWSRGTALARLSFEAGARAAGHAIGTVFADEKERAERFRGMVFDQARLVARELGRLKGTAMKAGQLLSMYGEHLLPPEANALLKTLQSQAPPLAWEPIEKVLLQELGAERLRELEIEREPYAAASLGQVHRARELSTGRELALKVQYPGVDRAIDSDLKAVRRVLSTIAKLPSGPRFDEIFEEIREMLAREVDYRDELEATEEVRRRLSDDPRYVVPEPVAAFSTQRVLATVLEAGVGVDAPEVAELSPARRAALAEAHLELYLRELFEWHWMQTDPHLGNYRIQVGEGGRPDRLVLLDFGAMRKFEQPFIGTYLEFVRAAVRRNAGGTITAGERLGFLRPGDSPEIQQGFAELCFLITEVFDEPGGRPYDWKGSDLPKRVMRRGAEVAFSFKLRPPPREIVFLDRKMGGVFIFLSVLNPQFSARRVLARHVPGLERPAGEACLR